MSVHVAGLPAVTARTYARPSVLAGLDPGAAVAASAGLLFAVAGVVVMLVSMPDGLRGSFIGLVLVAVGVLLAGVGASIQTEVVELRRVEDAQ